MADFTETLQAKSDQLNALDLAGDFTITVTQANLTGSKEQPLAIIYVGGDPKRPYKPSKGMRRVIASAWGCDTEQLIGKSMTLYCDPTVIYAGKEVGGIRIKAMSHIKEQGINIVERISRTKNKTDFISFLSMDKPDYPQASFEKGLPKMIEAMNSGDMTLEAVISKCQEKYKLTPTQLETLSKNAPVITDETDDGFEL